MTVTCVSQNLEYESSVSMIKKKPLKASDARSYENEDRADDSPGPADLQSVVSELQLLLLPGSLGFHDPGGRQGGQEEADLSPVAQEPDVAVGPVGVGEVHGLADGAPAHPDQGLHHAHDPSQSQDVPPHWARPELGTHQPRQVIAIKRN